MPRLEMKEVILRVNESLIGDSLPAEVELRCQKIIIVPYTGTTIIFAKNQNNQRFVIKFPTRETKAKREWTGLSKAYTAGVSTPLPIALVTNKYGHIGVMLEEVDGQSLYNHPDEQARTQLGQIVRAMHSSVPIEGTEWLEKGKADYTYYERLIREWLDGQVYLTDKNSTTQALLRLLSTPMSAYCKSTPPKFNHNDLYDGQAIVRKQKVTLIDFEEWAEESPLNDIGYYLFHTIRTGMPNIHFWSFLNGYLGNEVFSEIEKQALMFYLLFISSRALNYFNNLKSIHLKTATRTHQEVVDYVENEKFWVES